MATYGITSKLHSSEEDTKQIQTLFKKVKIVARAIRKLSDRVSDDNIARVHKAFALLEDAFQGKDGLHSDDFAAYVQQYIHNTTDTLSEQYSCAHMFAPRRQAILEVTNIPMIRQYLFLCKAHQSPFSMLSLKARTFCQVKTIVRRV